MTIPSTSLEQRRPLGLVTQAPDPIIENIHLKAQLAQAMQSLAQLSKPVAETEKDHIYITTVRRLQKVFFKDICWIEAERNYATIFTAAEFFVIKWPISKIEDQLPKTQFSRIHKSYIVANAKVEFIEKGQIGLKYESELKILPLGAQYKKLFIESIEHLILKSKVAH